MIYYRRLRRNGGGKRKTDMNKITVFALFAMAVSASVAAKEHAWPRLPDGALPDTEVSTNVALRVDAARLDTFSLKLQVADSSASEVLVAVGHDADENGDLSFDEAAFVFGQDCGVRYLASNGTGRVFTGVGDTLAVNHRFFNPAWNLAKIVKRGEGAVGETVTATIGNKRFALIIR